MDKEKRAVVFCSASSSIDPKYNQAAREVVRAACLHGYTLVSGGAVKGTMGVIAEEAHRLGVPHWGVLPRFMEEFVYDRLTNLEWVETMAVRKERMREGTCVAIALPGGIGTMDELVETHVLAKLGQYSGKILVLDLDGFYRPYRELLDHYVATGMMTPEDAALVTFVTTTEELSRELSKIEV